MSPSTATVPPLLRLAVPLKEANHGPCLGLLLVSLSCPKWGVRESALKERKGMGGLVAERERERGQVYF